MLSANLKSACADILQVILSSEPLLRVPDGARNDDENRIRRTPRPEGRQAITVTWPLNRIQSEVLQKRPFLLIRYTSGSASPAKRCHRTCGSPSRAEIHNLARGCRISAAATAQRVVVYRATARGMR